MNITVPKQVIELAIEKQDIVNNIVNDVKSKLTSGVEVGPTEKVISPDMFSNVEDFDKFLREWPGGLIFMQAGTYITTGYSSNEPEKGSYIPPRTALQGEPGTFVQLCPPSYATTGFLRALGSPVHRKDLYGGNSSVKDLVVLSLPSMPNLVISSVNLCGPNCEIERVRVCSQSNFSNDQECFPISISDLPDYPCDNCKIEDCVFEGNLDSDGKQFTIMSIAGQFAKAKRCKIKNNRVVVGSLTIGSRPSYGNAFTISGGEDCVIEDNFLDGFLIGVYQDTWPTNGLVVRGNVFRNCQSGITFLNDSESLYNYVKGYTTWRNIMIQNNMILLKNSKVADEDWPNSGIVLTNMRPHKQGSAIIEPFENCFVQGNFINTVNPPVKGKENWAIIAHNHEAKPHKGVVVTGNWYNNMLRISPNF